MSSHGELYQRALDAIRALGEDMSVPDSVVAEDLQRLKDNIDLMMEFSSPSKNEEG